MIKSQIKLINIIMKHDELDELIEEVWKVYDSDSNGYLDKKEARMLFTDIYEAQGQKLDPKELNRIMQLIDANGDGKMEKSELKKILS